MELGKSKTKQPDLDGFSPIHRCCQEPPPKAKPKVEENSNEPQILDANLEKEQRAQDDAMRSEIVKLLVAKGADVRVREPKGDQTPLHLAAINGYAFVCK